MEKERGDGPVDKMRFRVLFGILWLFTGGSSGFLHQDPVVCKFTHSVPTECYAAQGQRLHLQMVEEDRFSLILSNNPSTNHFILKYTKTQLNQPKPDSSRWQFVRDNKTMILNCTERSDSGKYTLVVNDEDWNIKTFYNLQLKIEAEVSSVKVSYSCLSPGIRKVSCSADGDNLHFSWTSDLKLFTRLEDGNSSLLLEQNHGNVTCHVENHVSSIVFGILLMFTGAASGSLFQDHVCRFNQIKPCYVAVGQRLQLQIPLEDGFDLQTTSLILRYRKTQSSPPTPRESRWQFVDDSKTIILTSAERNNSGTYTLTIFDVDGRNKSSSTLQVNIEAQVSSVNVSYSCLSPGVMKVNCSAEGDNLHFSWTSNTLPQLENGTSTVTLKQDHQGNITCHVENNVSRDHDTAELQCPKTTTTTTSTVENNWSSSISSLGTNSTVSHNETNSCNQTLTTIPPSFINSFEFLKLIFAILGSICVVLIILSIFAFYTYKKTHGPKNKAASQDDGVLYAHINHSAANNTETRARTSRAQVEDVEYATVVPRASKKKPKKYEEEVQYGELVFNTPAKNPRQTPKVEDDCVYSQVQRGL
ncbi:hypothetical protein Q7C36_017093 [Tachysurus vachellii]|uniref:Ig-like domain-containing protein n=1 Tax=Tachysurus vachellii TaxID=175792 RepID=A0AA88S731_TACVA|nr:hypothetical protein Q7C36_017093 [Tachysurus vachellii]